MRPKRCTMCNKRARPGSFTCSDECSVARRWRQVSLNRHRQRSKVAGTYEVTVEDWFAILRAFDYHCAYCNKQFSELTVDHVVPLSRGGRHCIANLVPACKNCNQKKGNLTVVEWRNLTRSQIQSKKAKLNNAKRNEQPPWVVDPDLGIRPVRKRYKAQQTPIFDQVLQAQHDRIILKRMGITVDHFGPIS